MAFSPIGVAALSSPSMLAEIHEYGTHGRMSFRYFGKRDGRIPDSANGKGIDHAAVSPIFITPSQRASIPVSPRDISKAVLVEEKVELTSSVNISTSP